MTAVRLINARGVPGAAAAVVVDRDGARHLLSCYHVVFGEGAVAGDRVVASVDDAAPLPVGRGERGQLGRVTLDGTSYFIDGALVRIEDTATALVAPLLDVAGVAAAEVGARVVKDGPISGRTEGTIVSIDHYEYPQIAGASYHATRQLLIRGSDPDLGFSVDGDSGAAVLDDQGRVLGVLWGSNALGDGVAAPIAPILDHLQVTLCRGTV